MQTQLECDLYLRGFFEKSTIGKLKSCVNERIGDCLVKILVELDINFNKTGCNHIIIVKLGILVVCVLKFT